MIAYTGIETVSNLAEEARDPTRSIPASIRLVAVAVFAIYFTLPLVALSALPVYKDAAGDYVTKLGLPPDQGGFENDPVLGLVENLGLHGLGAQRGEGLRRRPRRDDPLHRHERRRDRRVADHVLDGDATGSCRRSSGACTRASRRRGSRSLVFAGVIPIAVLLPGKVDFLGTMYSFGAMLSFTIAHASIIALRREAGRAGSSTARGRTCAIGGARLAALRAPRRARHRDRLDRRRRPVPAGALGGPRLARGRVRLLLAVPPPGRASSRCARPCARRCSCSGRR